MILPALYLDPTTGSIAFQAAIGGLLAATAAVRLYWSRIRLAIHRIRPSRRPQSEREPRRTAAH